MEKKSHDFETQKYLPISLLNDIEFDELDQELQSIENYETNNSSYQEK
jgi:hypothetical protein